MDYLLWGKVEVKQMVKKFKEMERKDHFKDYKSYIYSRCYIYCIPLEKWRTA